MLAEGAAGFVPDGALSASVLRHADLNDIITIVQELGLGIVMMPMVSILQHLAIAKHYTGTAVPIHSVIITFRRF